ncbi:hypothetical protein FC72_GL002045 [Companilactobacillus tucceti DSM 20183]|uniref:Uncharacterized protein n=1 Tax=Companilactobacillus tucceti DSM 20183 TaxID=1423811 RepID=A0A0R1IZ96_9LACO|nr:hypothetical protein [Companilactobacillus tucceti]KRK64637.1 hypothetical protein FC72_GL002045 [Companilactobacillus tucceti DSM 20183]
MKNKYKLNLWGLIFLMSIFAILITNTNNVSADLITRDDKDVLQDAPDGVAIGNYLTKSTVTNPPGDDKFPYKTNSAQILDRSGASAPSTGNIISLANGRSSYGALWSNGRTFDITKPQTISFWVYFGTGAASDDINGEGISFVLQNDSRGTAALGAGLEGLGVYGADTATYSPGFLLTPESYTSKTPSYMATTAVQNSMALEIDAKNNNFHKESPIQLKKEGLASDSSLYSQNSFDTHPGGIPTSSKILGTLSYGTNGGQYGNISVTYPALTDTYSQTDEFSDYSNYDHFNKLTMMVKSNSTDVDLTNDKDANGNPVYWHHMTINWTPAPTTGSNKGIATLTYTYNDISKGGIENTNSKTVSNPINIDNLKAPASNKVLWGFTGATTPSDYAATKLIAFDSIPESPTTDVSASITDKTLHKKITDESTDKTVANGDDLSLDYNLEYIRGDDDWKSIVSKIKIPDNFEIKPDAQLNVATITYSDGKEPEVITNDEWQHDTGTLQHQLLRVLSNDNNVANISISGTATNDTSSDINVKQAPASFTGTNSIAMTSSPAFTILAKKDYSLNLSTDNTDYKLLYKNEDASLSSNLNLGYSSNAPSDLKGSDIVFNVTIGDHNYTAAQDLSLQSGQTSSATVDFKKLIEGAGDNFGDVFPVNSTQQIKVKAIDRTNGLISNEVTYNVNVMPDKSLALNVSDSLAFQNIHFGNKSTYLKRASDFNLSVTSLREPWQLSVTSNGLYNTDNSLNKNMNLVYRKDNNSDYVNIGDTPVIVATNDQSYTTSTTNNISGDWTNDTGLLLKQLGLSPAGHYTGTLTWTTSDVIGNN